MIGSFVSLLLKRSKAPEWFYLDKKNQIPTTEIVDKIKIEIYNEAFNRGYSLELWNDVFITKMSQLYYRFLNQLYVMKS